MGTLQIQIYRMNMWWVLTTILQIFTLYQQVSCNQPQMFWSCSCKSWILGFPYSVSAKKRSLNKCLYIFSYDDILGNGLSVWLKVCVYLPQWSQVAWLCSPPQWLAHRTSWKKTSEMKDELALIPLMLTKNHWNFCV